MARAADGPGAFDDDAELSAGAGLAIGTDERRMQVRAYNHWVSLLCGRPYPTIGDIDPAAIADFGPHSVLLDFSDGLVNPRIAFLGSALRQETGLGQEVTRIAEVPNRSLLSRLTDHYLEIIANRAPVGFEAEFVGIRGNNTFYRGILMPFSSDGSAIDFIYGVINWKEMVDAATHARLTAELDAAIRSAPPAQGYPAVWEDGPSALSDRGPTSGPSLAELYEQATRSSAHARDADVHARAATHAALGDIQAVVHAARGVENGLAQLLALNGGSRSRREPTAALIHLILADFAADRRTELCRVVTAAERQGIAPEGLPAMLDAMPGGVRQFLRAGRADAEGTA